jgi:diguanylate cyclase (GGDEF)-like protein
MSLVPSKIHAALLDLHRMAPDLDEPALYSAAIEIAVSVTGSEIGYFHLVNEDQETIELGTWSAGTLLHCNASYQRHYPISEAGVWADSARMRRACLHNDYQTISGRRGYPEGHVHLVRHLGTPVIDQDRVVLLVGVGNKPEDYTDGDLACLQAVSDQIWPLICRQRQKLSLMIAQQQLHELQELGAICVWQWDPEEQALGCDKNFRRIFVIPHPDEFVCSLENLLHFIDVRDHSVVLDLLRDPPGDASFNVYVRGFRGDGASIILNFRGAAYPRSQGHGIVLRGILQDSTGRREIESSGYHATHDALTGLANRALLIAQLKALLHSHPGKSGGTFAVLFINLIHFKSVNDSFGHGTGDEVLKVIAGRLLRLADKNELVARAGGDEIVVVQNRVSTPEEAESLASAIAATIQRPIEVGKHLVEMGVSIGIVLASPGIETSKDLLWRAEQAMHHARNTDRGIHQLTGDAPGKSG